MRCDVFDRLPFCSVSGGLYGIWVYQVEIGMLEIRIRRGLTRQWRCNVHGRSWWVWGSANIGNGLTLILWRRGRKGQQP